MENATDPPPSAQGTAGAPPIDVGSVVDGWRLDAILGRGGMGVVYRAGHETTGISAALKVFQPSGSEGQQALRRFRREVLALARLEHPLVVRILQESLDHEPPYFCMELLPGGSLAQRLEAAGGAGLTPEALTRLTLELAEGLEAVHGARVLHRDIKPQNVLFTIDGQAKLADFGIAKAQDLTGLTMVGQVMGTFAYMAPESICGRPGDERTDLYQLGVTLFEAAAGKRPFSSEQIMAVMATRRLPLLSKLAPFTSQLLPWLQPVLDRLTAGAPEARFQSASELLETVRRQAERFPLPASGVRYPAATPARLAATPEPLATALAAPPVAEATSSRPVAESLSAHVLSTSRMAVTPPTELASSSRSTELPPDPPEPEPARAYLESARLAVSKEARPPGQAPRATSLATRGMVLLPVALLVLAAAWRLSGPPRPAAPAPASQVSGLWLSAGSNRARLWLSGPAPAGSRLTCDRGNGVDEEVRAGENVVTLEGLQPGQTCSGEVRLGDARFPYTLSTGEAGEFPDSVVVSDRTLASASIRLWAKEDHVRLLWARTRAGGGCDLMLAESVDHGQTWGGPQELATAGAGLDDPKLDLAVSAGWVAWTDPAKISGRSIAAQFRPGTPLAPAPAGALLELDGPGRTVWLVPGTGSSAELYAGLRDERSGTCLLSRARLTAGATAPPPLLSALALGAGKRFLPPRLLRMEGSLLALLALGPASERKSVYWSSCAAGAEGDWTPPAMLIGGSERVEAFDAVRHGTRAAVAYETGQPADPTGSQVKVLFLEPDGSASAAPQAVRGADFAPLLAAGEGACFLGAVARGSGNRTLFRILREDSGAGWGPFRELDCKCGLAARSGRFAMAVAAERLVLAHADAEGRLLVTSLLRDGSAGGP